MEASLSIRRTLSFCVCIGLTLANTTHQWLNTIVNERYDRFVHPMLALDEYSDSAQPTEVTVQFYVESIGNYRTATMDYDLDIYLIEYWNDHRLRHSKPIPYSFNDPDLIKSLWKPDIYFTNSKSARYNFVTVPNTNFQVWRNGSVRFSSRVSIKASCQMNLQMFPVDRQTCNLELQPYTNDMSHVRILWTEPTAKSKPIAVNPQIKQAELLLESIQTEYCDGTYETKNFSCLLAVFQLKRTIGSSLLSIYIPTFFIVMISWISFWIDPGSAPARVGLAVTTLLTFSTQSAGIRYRLPIVSYAKALDFWLFGCLVFLFGVLVEFAVVNMFSRLSQSKRKKATKEHDSLMTGNCTSANYQSTADLAERYRRKAVAVDRISRILFPAMFFLFMFVYWCMCLL